MRSDFINMPEYYLLVHYVYYSSVVKIIRLSVNLPCAPLFLYHGALTYLAKLFTHKSEEGFYRFCSKRLKFCSFARHTLTINTTPIPSIAMHISSLLDPFHVQFKFLSTPKYHYSKKCPELHMEELLNLDQL
jgi:hypothetical protein